MTQEEKQLLLKDLCARIPYRPKGVKLNKFGDKDITVTGHTGRFVETVDDEIEVERVRLYLRPLSSMSSDEKMEWFQMRQKHCNMSAFNALKKRADFTSESLDWLNKKGFDYRGIIEKGLAFEAPEGMYKL